MHSMVKTLLRIGAVAVGFALLAPLPVAAQNPPGLGPLDHYKVYRVEAPLDPPVTVELRDQFGAGSYEVVGPRWFSPPAQKNQEPTYDMRIHLTWYDIFSPVRDPIRRVLVHNQFGSSDLEVANSRYLLVPSLKNETILPEPFPPLPLDHYKCYNALGPPPVPARTVTLVTQFGTEVVQVGPPELLCNPTDKIHLGFLTPIQDVKDHLVCYAISLSPPLLVGFQLQNQFGTRSGLLRDNRWLCVPSLKEISTATEGTTWSRVRALYR
jgi:hypothetical protein